MPSRMYFSFTNLNLPGESPKPLQPPWRLQVAPWGDEPRELHLCGASIGLQRACHRHSHVECHATRILVRSWGCGSFWETWPNSKVGSKRERWGDFENWIGEPFCWQFCHQMELLCCLYPGNWSHSRIWIFEKLSALCAALNAVLPPVLCYQTSLQILFFGHPDMWAKEKSAWWFQLNRKCLLPSYSGYEYL